MAEMSELKVYHCNEWHNEYTEFYMKYEADNVIAEKDAKIAELKSRITPKQSDRPLQERLNEVCKKHGVSTLQDLDWAFCESEKRHTKDCIEAVKVIVHNKYKRCLAMSKWCFTKSNYHFVLARHGEDVKENNRRSILYSKWRNCWLELAEQFKPNKEAK